jgi:hypothetical protein
MSFPHLDFGWLSSPGRAALVSVPNDDRTHLARYFAEAQEWGKSGGRTGAGAGYCHPTPSAI